ncbi:MAG: hypothetical protein CSA66_07650 [Proteobacteria bacterium]|nr:MAG: hypothetical protein CSA66_07650 [Pseudomonadota bacterium]
MPLATPSLAAIAAGLTLLLGGACGPSSPYLKLNLGGGVVPIVNGADPGGAVGQCLRFDRSGPTTAPCPPGVDAFFGKPKLHQMSQPGTYTNGIYAHGEMVAYSRPVVVGYELLTYSSRAVSWKKKLKAKDVPKLRRLCADPHSRQRMVVVRAFEGCAVVMAGLQRDATEWTIETLSHQGSRVGLPTGFWAQAPDEELPPLKAKCKAKRVVQAEVIRVETACRRYAGELEPPEDQPTPGAPEHLTPAGPPAVAARR